MAHSKEQIFKKVQALAVEQIGVEEEDITLEATLIDELGFDSLDVVELVMAIEEEFEFTISDEEICKCEQKGDISIKAIVDYIYNEENN